MSRVSFSPYEATLWEWQVTMQNDQDCLLSPLWCTDSLPLMVTHKQLAKEFSLFTDLQDWKWNVVPYQAGSERLFYGFQLG